MRLSNGAGWFAATWGLALLAAGCGGRAGPSPQSLARVRIEVGGRPLSVEVARTEGQRRAGMMYRGKLGANEGMLFVFPEPQILSFYMKDTYVPLSIAFIRANGVIDRITEMMPRSLAIHESNTLCLYALEMPRGWFEERGIREGAKVTIAAEAGAGDGG